MTNALGISSVSRLLKASLQAMTVRQGLSVAVSALPPRPAAPDAGAELNVHLYRVTPAAQQRDPGAARGPGGRLPAPRLALDLHYLVSVRSSREFEAEALLGQAMAAFHETPMIATSQLQALLPDDPGRLADQVEIIRITPLDLPLAEVSELWRALKVEARPAAAYQVSGLQIEQAGVQSSAPVLRRRADDLDRTDLGGVFGRAERALGPDEHDDLFEPRRDPPR